MSAGRDDGSRRGEGGRVWVELCVALRVVGRDALERGNHVVEESTRVVVDDQQQRAVPLRPAPKGLVDVLLQTLAQRDVVARVVVVGLLVAGVDTREEPREHREGAVRGGMEEVAP